MFTINLDKATAKRVIVLCENLNIGASNFIMLAIHRLCDSMEKEMRLGTHKYPEEPYNFEERMKRGHDNSDITQQEYDEIIEEHEGEKAEAREDIDWTDKIWE